MCDCQTDTNPIWEPESIQVFKALADGKFPLNKRVKDALDIIVKIAKSGDPLPPAIVVTANSNTITNDAIKGRMIAMLVIDGTSKVNGFIKQGVDEASQLLSDTVIINDNSVIDTNSTVVIIFK
jgi:hypothetical protein